MLPREYTSSKYDSSPHLTACKILVILIDSSFVEQVEEYTVLNATFNNISVVTWGSHLLLEETEENHEPAASH